MHLLRKWRPKPFTWSIYQRQCVFFGLFFVVVVVVVVYFNLNYWSFPTKIHQYCTHFPNRVSGRFDFLWSVCDECTIYLLSISTPQCYVQRQCRQLKEAFHYSWSSPHTRPWCGILVWQIKSPWTWHPTREHKALCRSDQSPQCSAKHNTTSFRTWKAKLTPTLSEHCFFWRIFVYNI